jgi:hypothetical protein
VDEAGDQRQPLVRVQDIPQVGDIGDAGLAREASDLPGRDALQPRLGRPDRVDAGQQLQAQPDLPSDADFATSFSRSNSLRRVTGSTASSLPSRRRATGPIRPATG